MKGMVGLIQADKSRTCKVGRKASSGRERIHALLSETRKLDVTRKEQEQKRKGRETKKGKEEGTEGAGRRT